jgi:hypothetical protein
MNPNQAPFCAGGCGLAIQPTTSAWCDACLPPAPCTRRGCANGVSLLQDGAGVDICLACRGLKLCANADGSRGRCASVMASDELADLCPACRHVQPCATRGCASMIPAGRDWPFCQLCTRACATVGCKGSAAMGLFCVDCEPHAYGLLQTYVHHEQQQQQQQQQQPQIMFGDPNASIMMEKETPFLESAFNVIPDSVSPVFSHEAFGSSFELQPFPNAQEFGFNMSIRSPSNISNAGTMFSALEHQVALDFDSSSSSGETMFSALDLQTDSDFEGNIVPLNLLISPFSPAPSDPADLFKHCVRCGSTFVSDDGKSYCPQCDSEALLVVGDEDITDPIPFMPHGA